MMKAQLGQGHFQWTAGAWFGAQLGSTLYLVILGALMSLRSPGLGLLVVLCGLAPNLFGLALWKRRRELSPYSALQSLLCAVAVATTIAVTCVTLLGVGHPPEERVSALLDVLWMLPSIPA